MSTAEETEKKTRIRKWAAIGAAAAVLAAVVAIVVCVMTKEKPPVPRAEDPVYQAALDSLGEEKSRLMKEMLRARGEFDAANASGSASEEDLKALEAKSLEAEKAFEEFNERARMFVRQRIKQEAEEIEKFNMKGAK